MTRHNTLARAFRLGELVILAALILCAGAGGALADTAPSGYQAASTQVVGKPDLYDVDASGTEVKSVLETLARCSGVNIIVSPDIQGEITAHVKQMPLDRILDYLSTVAGFAWQKNGDAYLVASKEKLGQPQTPPIEIIPPRPEILVWLCRNIKPADVVSAIQKLFPKMQVVEGPGAVTPTLSSTAGTTASMSSFGASASTASSAGQSGGGTESKSNKIVIMGDPADVAKAKEILVQLDVARQQVTINVAITEISETGSKELGLEWSFSDLVLRETPSDSGIGFGRFAKQGVTLTGTISALMKSGNASLLAQPNIAVVDGECANILIGDRILFPKLVGYTQFGTPMYDKEEEQIGISLQIVPKITGKDEIMLTLYPQVSLVTSYLKTQAGDYPQISTREAKTTVLIKNGETLAIGGLLRDDTIRSLSKVPILGDLPIIGGLFKRVKTTKERTEIVIFLSPNILSSE